MHVFTVEGTTKQHLKDNDLTSSTCNNTVVDLSLWCLPFQWTLQNVICKSHPVQNGRTYVQGPPWLRTIVPWPIRLCGRLTESTSSSLRQHAYTSRLIGAIQPQSNRSTVGDRAFPVAGPQVWNSLPPEVTSAPSLDTFRTEDSSVHRVIFEHTTIVTD